ncbi:calcium ion binding [Mactra antiquata]
MNGKNRRSCSEISLRNLSFFHCIVLCSVSCVFCEEYKTCDDVGTFQHFTDFSWNKCSDECARRRRCKIFMFRQKMNYCSLKNATDVTSFDKTRPICGYFVRDENIPHDLGPCRGQPCDETERCTSKTKTEYECLKTECHTPKEIENAKLLSNTYSIGTTNRYKCKNGLVGRGSPSIVCLKNGTWSQADFKCVLPPMACRELKNHYYNSIRTKVEKVGYTGTVFTYTCRNGYNKVIDKVSLTCQKSGNWSSNRIHCCHDNSTKNWDVYCIAIVNGGLISIDQEAYKYCRDIGGVITWASYHAKDLFNETTTRFVLQAKNKSSTDLEWDYGKCASANGAVGDPTKTFDEKVQEIRKNMWFGPDCKWGQRFIPGQPDGGDQEQCLVRDLQYFFQHLDLPCTFKQKNVGFICGFGLPSTNE